MPACQCSHEITPQLYRLRPQNLEARSLCHSRISWTHGFDVEFYSIMNSTRPLAMLEILPSWAQESLVDSKAVFITAVAGLLVVTLSTYRLQSQVQHDKSGIHELGGWSRFTAWPFFSRRYDFLHSNWEKTGQELFQFRVLQVSNLLPHLYAQNIDMQLAYGSCCIWRGRAQGVP